MNEVPAKRFRFARHVKRCVMTTEAFPAFQCLFILSSFLWNPFVLFWRRGLSLFRRGKLSFYEANCGAECRQDPPDRFRQLESSLRGCEDNPGRLRYIFVSRWASNCVEKEVVQDV